MNNGRQVVLITGASSGMGKETAKTLIGEGYTVYAAARRVERMEDLKKLGGIPLKMDVTKEEDVVAAVEQITRDHGGVDILINNAGYGLYGAVEDVALDEARYQFEVNMFGMACLTQQVLPYMRQKRAGKIVNISSMGGKIYTTLGAWYHATKHAVEGWSDCLRLELKQFNIDVIIIEPGGIQTDFLNVTMSEIEKHTPQDSAYRPMVDRMAGMSSDMSPDAGSPPSVIANTISRAIRARRPRTRYAVGYGARPLIFIRKWFGDRTFDWVLGRMF
jgi:NAD(P)-dependent dehydrogenase (short-subunit alcohol dehydrogenase family)